MKNKKTFKEVFGKNPWDPWSAKAGISETSEAQLSKYLLSRGINPQYVSKDTKIAHSKSNQFKIWAQSHNEEVNEDHVAIAMGKQLDDEGSMVLNQLDILDGAIAKLRDTIKDPKMQIPAWVQSKITLAADYMDTVGHYMSSKNEDGINEEVEKLDELKTSTLLRYATKANKSLIGGNRNKEDKRIKGIQKANYKIQSKYKVSEETLDEAKPLKIKIKDKPPTAAERLYQKHQELRKKSGLPDPEHYKKLGAQKQAEIDAMKNEEGDPCWKGYTQVGMKTKNGSEVPNCVPSKGVPKAKGYKKESVEESVLIDDPKGTMTRVAERKKEMTRSARIIKSIYKKKNVKEELYDHEKDKKDPARVHGKKPKMEKADERLNATDSKPKAAAILSGGTTLTKQPRDTVELDPMMKTRPGVNAGDDKVSKKKL